MEWRVKKLLGYQFFEETDFTKKTIKIRKFARGTVKFYQKLRTCNENDENLQKWPKLKSFPEKVISWKIIPPNLLGGCNVGWVLRNYWTPETLHNKNSRHFLLISNPKLGPAKTHRAKKSRSGPRLGPTRWQLKFIVYLDKPPFSIIRLFFREPNGAD